MSKTYLFAAGGTGGHIIPALAVASALQVKEPESRIVFVGTGKELEHRLIADRFELRTIEFVPVLGKGFGGLVRMLLRFPAALLQGIAILRELRVDSLIAFGGYPSFVPFVASFMLGIRRILFEQNVKVGLANKVLGVLANYVYAVPGATGFLVKAPSAFIANPIRPEFGTLSEYQPPSDTEPLNILLLGGSQGAVALNLAMVEIASRLPAGQFTVTHVAGGNNKESCEELYAARGLSHVTVHGFVSEPWKLIEAAHLIVSRAGAGAVSELCAAARPVVYIPLAIAAAHQSENIADQVAAGAALEIMQDEHLVESLEHCVRELRAKPEKLANLAGAMKGLADRNKALDAAEILAEKLRGLSS